LRDVLGFPAFEMADKLGSTVESANSVLKRAPLQPAAPPAADLEPPPAATHARRMRSWRSSFAGGSPADLEILRLGPGVPAMFFFRDPDGNTLQVIEGS